MNVLFVCVQNAGRSQIAEALFSRGPPAVTQRGPPGRSPRPTFTPGRGSHARARGRDRGPRAAAARRRRRRVGRRHRDDGLRRRMPLRPGQAIRRLGARGPPRGQSNACARSATRSGAGSSSSSASSTVTSHERRVMAVAEQRRARNRFPARTRSWAGSRRSTATCHSGSGSPWRPGSRSARSSRA